MYGNAKSTVNINGTIGDPFPVKVGVHQGSLLSPLLFIIVLEALSREFRTGLPWELLYADDLVLMHSVPRIANIGINSISWLKITAL